MKELTPMQIRFLLWCVKRPISKTDVTKIYRQYSIEERDECIQGLLDSNLVEMRVLPKANARKSPTFYYITDKGKKWLTEYEKNFPE
jgi:hypothetical protein